MLPWDELRIAPTGDARLIRKAYAARLKQTRPEDDAAGFTRLRAAYESALAMATRLVAQPAEAIPADPGPRIDSEKPPAETANPAIVRTEPVDPREAEEARGETRAAAEPIVRAERVDPDEDENPRGEAAKPRIRQVRLAAQTDDGRRGEPPPPTPPGPRIRVERLASEKEEPVAGKPIVEKPVQTPPVRPNQPTPAEALLLRESRAAIQAVTAALNRRAGEEAAALLSAAAARNLLPLRTEFGLEDKLAAILLADTTISTERLLEIAKRFGWYDTKDVVRRRSNGFEDRLCARIERELLTAAARQQAADEPPTVPAKAPKQMGTAGLIWTIIVVLSLLGRCVGGLSGSNHAVPERAPVHDNGPSTLQRSQDTPAAPMRPIAVAGSACAFDSDGNLERSFLPPGQRQNGTLPLPAVIQGPGQALAKNAEAGDVTAQYELGMAYYRGDGVPGDVTGAASWLHRAALQNHRDARTFLAILCQNGRGTPVDAAGARSLFLESARRSDPRAQTWFASMAIGGEGGPTDRTAGFAWAKRAASLGYLPAMTMLGNLYAGGTGTGRDPAKSAAWLHAAAAAGDRAAMTAYANMALRGDGIPVDLAEAYRWFSLAVQEAPDGSDRTSARTALAALHKAGSFEPLAPEKRAAIDLELKTWHPVAAVPPVIDAP
jgi:TPR repeat protein